MDPIATAERNIFRNTRIADPSVAGSSLPRCTRSSAMSLGKGACELVHSAATSRVGGCLSKQGGISWPASETA